MSNPQAPATVMSGGHIRHTGPSGVKWRGNWPDPLTQASEMVQTGACGTIKCKTYWKIV